MAEDPGKIREAIEETRAEIAQTMEALGHKADVKQRLRKGAKEKSEEVKTQVSTTADHLMAQTKAALPESAQPTADAAFSSLRRQAELVSSDKNRQLALAIGAGLFLLIVLLRRRNRT